MQTEFTKLLGGVLEKMSALSVHPAHGVFVTASSDCTVTMWGGKMHQELWSTSVQYPATAAAFYNSGEDGSGMMLGREKSELVDLH